ncbi:MAG: hypothetical protein CMN03_04670 [Roseibacillus sp.]|nr:hypothetical protein [Roseibacillus sp.]
MDISDTNEGIEVKTSSYRLLLERAGGFAGRKVEIFGAGRLDRFDRPGEGPHPTCMHFDNMTVNNAFQLAHYGKTNSSVTAEVAGSEVRLSGELIPIVDEALGTVSIEKTMCFEDDTYDVEVHLGFEDTGPIDFASVWWDVHDKWLRAMRSSAGVFMPLQVGIGDSCDDDLHKSFRPMTGMDRGAGVWMEMIGESASIMAALRSPVPDQLPAGGMKFWDGPDDADAGDGVSHGCINLDLINCELSGSEPLDIDDLQCAYRVFLSGPTVVRSTPRTEQE